jgi:hypothetical protein
VSRSARLLLDLDPDLAHVCQLISRFRIFADELTESGVPYEMVRALEWRYPHLLAERI